MLYTIMYNLYIFLGLRSLNFIIQKLKINIVINSYIYAYGSRKYYIVWDNRLLCEKLEKLIRLMSLKKGLTLC